MNVITYFENKKKTKLYLFKKYPKHQRSNKIKKKHYEWLCKKKKTFVNLTNNSYNLIKN